MERPTTYSEELAAQICEALKLGAPLEVAAEAAGVSYETAEDWRKRYEAFDMRVGQALAEGIINALRHIEAAAANGQWQAAAWLLERRYPQIYGRQTVEQKHAGDLRIVVQDSARMLMPGKKRWW